MKRRLLNDLKYLALGLPAILFLLLNFLYLDWSPVASIITFFGLALFAGLASLLIRISRNKSARTNIARNLGEVLHQDSQSLSFQRGNAIIQWEAALAGHAVSFFVPKVPQKILIRQREWTDVPQNVPLMLKMMPQSSYGSEEDAFYDCKWVEVPVLSTDIAFRTNDEAFLWAFLDDPQVRAEVEGYRDEKFKLSFTAGAYEFRWETGSNENLNQFRRVCQSAVIFLDALGRRTRRR